ncbi:MAG: type II toxin-antitoxin system VapB family antitoxin [Reyranellaceae bacterium]
MAWNIENPETERIVRELAERTGLTITEAVHQAALEKLRSMDEDRERRRQAIYEIVERAKSLLVLDSRPIDEILGYNNKGTFD